MQPKSTMSALLVLTLVFAACGSSLDTTYWTEQGETTLQPFKQKLMRALTDGLADGPVNAINACQIVAPVIADEIASDSLKVGRTSHKLRNPRNLPKTWVQPLLQEYVSNPDKTEPTVVSLGERGVGYVEPIYVQQPCLTCHGTNIDPAVTKKLNELYPTDQATGFEEGDFRGLFWIEFPGTE